MPAQDGIERLAGDVLHDHPVVALGIGAQIVQIDQVLMLQIQALGHAAQLDFQVAARRDPTAARIGSRGLGLRTDRRKAQSSQRSDTQATMKQGGVHDEIRGK